jgi:hypothetical protein
MAEQIVTLRLYIDVFCLFFDAQQLNRCKQIIVVVPLFGRFI